MQAKSVVWKVAVAADHVTSTGGGIVSAVDASHVSRLQKWLNWRAFQLYRPFLGCLAGGRCAGGKECGGLVDE